MAVPRVYKSITAHQKLCEFAESFMIEYRQELVDALSEVFRKDAGEGESVPDVLPFVNAMMLRLRRSLEVLLGAETKHLDEVGNDATHRRDRDEAAASLRRIVTDLRGLFRSSFGLEEAQAVGFEAEIAQDPVSLVRQTSRLLDNLRRADLVLPPSKLEGVTVTPELVAAQIVPRLEALRGSVGQATRELGRVQGTQVAKDRALADFRGTYVLFLRILQGTFRLAGHDELAVRLRRAARRVSRTPDEGESPEPGAGEPGQGEPEEGEPGEGEPSDPAPAG